MKIGWFKFGWNRKSATPGVHTDGADHPEGKTDGGIVLPPDPAQRVEVDVTSSPEWGTAATLGPLLHAEYAAAVQRSRAHLAQAVSERPVLSRYLGQPSEGGLPEHHGGNPPWNQSTVLDPMETLLHWDVPGDFQGT